MPRWVSNLFISAYLGAMVLGIGCHALKFGTNSHPLMYYVVWDMFCGWSSHEIRFHVIGEGESGNYYRLAPGPWSNFSPYGELSRHHYDTLGNSFHKMALTTLRHTEHEPMRRILVLEECWPKKYNLPDYLWKLRYDEPKDPQSYFWLRQVHDADGKLLAFHGDWLSHENAKAIGNNPRLLADARRGKPFYAINPALRQSQHPLGSSQWESQTTTAGIPFSAN